MNYYYSIFYSDLYSDCILHTLCYKPNAQYYSYSAPRHSFESILSKASFRKQPFESSLSKAAFRKQPFESSLLIHTSMYCTVHYVLYSVYTLKLCITGAGHKLRAIHIIIDNKHKLNNLNI